MKNLTREQFVTLCNAVDNNIITLKQFKILSKMDYETTREIIEILSLETISNKEELTPKLLKINDTETLRKLKTILKEYPIYQTDLKRQRFILHHIQKYNTVILARILQNDIIWNNKELVAIIIKKFDNYDGYMINFARYMLIQIQEDPELYNNPQVLELFKKIMALESLEYGTECLRYLPLKCIQQKPEWMECLVTYYNLLDNYNIPVCTEKLQIFAEHNHIDKINEKFDEIKGIELCKEEKILIFQNFLKNLDKIDDYWITEEENRVYLNYLLDHVLEEDNFLKLVDLVEYAKENQYPLDQLTSVYAKINKIKAENVQGLALGIVTQQKIVDLDFLDKLEKVNYTQAQRMILEYCIKIKDKQSIEKYKPYFSEKIPQEFFDYLDSIDFNKEELLKIRDQIQSAPVEFKEEKFMIDTSHIIPKSFSLTTTSMNTIDKSITEGTVKKKTFSADKKLRNIFRGKK